MAYNEHIYVQKEGKAEDGSDKYPVLDLVESFGIYGKEIPFVVGGEVKNVHTNEWYDEDGDEEYVPDKLLLKAYDITIDFAYKGKQRSANEKVLSFIDYLTGRTDGASVMKLYSTYTGIGRQNVRLVKVNDDCELVREKGYDVLIFKVTFKINDPVTNIVLEKND